VNDVKKETDILVRPAADTGGAYPVSVQTVPGIVGDTPAAGPVPGGLADDTP
jgi:hypothetical protein